MSESFRDSARHIMQQMLNQTPEEWHAYYRQSYPDISVQETRTLYPLFAKAMTAPTKKERDNAFSEYRTKLEPIKRRNPPQREQELFKWT